MIGALLQVLFGNTLNQIAPVNEKRVRKTLNNPIIWVGKDLWRSLVQPVAQSWVTSGPRLPPLHTRQNPLRESRPFPPALPGFSHPISNPFPLNLLLQRKPLCRFLSCKCSPILLWVCCFACCPNPAPVCLSSPLLGNLSLIPQLCKSFHGLHHPSQLPLPFTHQLIHGLCQAMLHTPTVFIWHSSRIVYPTAFTFSWILLSPPERVKRKGQCLAFHRTLLFHLKIVLL